MVLGTELDQIGVRVFYPLSIHWHNIRSYYILIKLTPHGFLVILDIPESHLMKCSTFFVNSAVNQIFSINALTHALSASQAVIKISICCKSSPYPCGNILVIAGYGIQTTPKTKTLKFKRAQLQKSDKITSRFWCDSALHYRALQHDEHTLQQPLHQTLEPIQHTNGTKYGSFKNSKPYSSP